MTDGNNNVGEYLPLEAADIARSFGIDVFAIGIGDTISSQQQEVGGRTTIKPRTLVSLVQSS